MSHRRNRSLWLSLFRLMLLVSLFLFAVPVAADKPGQAQVDGPAPFILSGACSFPVAVDFPIAKQTVKIFDGNKKAVQISLVTGPLRANLTNLETGKSIRVNVPGPGKTFLYADGSSRLVATGPWLWTLQPGQIEGLPLLSYSHGRLAIEFDADGYGVVTSTSGKVEDLCLELGD